MSEVILFGPSGEGPDMKQALIDAWKDYEQKKKAAKEHEKKESIIKMKDAIQRFFSVSDEEAESIEIIKDPVHHTVYGRYRGIRLVPGRDGSGAFFISECPYCRQVTAGARIMNTHLDVGRALCEEQVGDFSPHPGHISICEKAPEWAVERAKDEDVAKPQERIIIAIRSLIEEIRPYLESND